MMTIYLIIRDASLIVQGQLMDGHVQEETLQILILV